MGAVVEAGEAGGANPWGVALTGVESPLSTGESLLSWETGVFSSGVEVVTVTEMTFP